MSKGTFYNENQYQNTLFAKRISNIVLEEQASTPQQKRDTRVDIPCAVIHNMWVRLFSLSDGSSVSNFDSLVLHQQNATGTQS